MEEIAKINDLQLDVKEFAEYMDKMDELATFREKFIFPFRKLRDENSGKSIYLCGNSLGLQPKTTSERISEELKDWADFGVEGHFPIEGNKPGSKRPWLITDDFVKEQMAKIVGAKPIEVAVMNSLSVNLHLMMVPFYRSFLFFIFFFFFFFLIFFFLFLFY